MEELLNFKYQVKELCLFYENQTPIYGKRENGIVSYDLTDEEKRLINSVYFQVMPSNKTVRRSDINLNGTTIAHFVDKRKDIHMFYEIKDNKVNILDKQLRIIFNNMFNNQNKYVISPSKHKTPNKRDGFFKRLIKIGKKTAIAFVASSIILGASYINPTIAKADDNVTKLEEFGEEPEKYQGIKHGLEKVYDDFDSLDKERIFDLTYKYPELLNKKLIVNQKLVLTSLLWAYIF